MPPPRTRPGSYPPAVAANEPGPGETHLEVNVCSALLRSQEVGRLAVSIADRQEFRLPAQARATSRVLRAVVGQRTAYAQPSFSSAQMTRADMSI